LINAERDSPRDQLVVTLFLLTVFGLLLGAGIKGRMIKAGIDVNTPWNKGQKWWQVSPNSLNITSPSDLRRPSIGHRNLRMFDSELGLMLVRITPVCIEKTAEMNM
jgi:hypothetical protein